MNRTSGRQPSQQPSRRSLAVLLSLIAVVGTIAMASIAGGVAAEPTTDVQGGGADSKVGAASEYNVTDIDEFGEADAVYIDEDGDAVFVFEEDSDVDDVEMGVDLGVGLAHLFVVDEAEETDGDAEFSSTVFLEEDRLSFDGSLVDERPDDLEDLALDVEGEVSDERNVFDGTLDATFADEQNQASDEFFDRLTTEGEITRTATVYEATGSFSTEAGFGGEQKPPEEVFDVTLTEADAAYHLAVTREESIGERSAERWETEEQARQHLEAQYEDLAADLGGSAEVDLEHHVFEEDGEQYWLEIEFDVEFTGVDEGVEQQLQTELASDPDLDLDEADAAEIAESVTNLQVDTIEITSASQGASSDVSWDVRLENYDEVAVAVLDVAESADLTEEEWIDQEEIDDTRAMIEAQSDADLRQNVEWEAEVTVDEQQTVVTAEVSAENENWDAYVSELEDRNVDTAPHDVHFSLHAHTQNDEIHVDGTFEIEQEELVDGAIEAFRESLEEEVAQPTGTVDETDESDADELQEFLAALEESNFEIARIDLNADSETVEVEASAKFDDVDAFLGDVDVRPDRIVVDADGETSKTYVYVEDLVEDGEDVTEEDVEHLTFVSEDTDVYEAGEWDEEFPDIDTEGVLDHLGLTPTPTPDVQDDGGDERVPGFGVLLALLALALGLALARRRLRLAPRD